MKLQRIPVIVTTHEALDIALAEKICVIFVGNELYLPQKRYDRLHDENIHEIYDPCGIL